MAHNRLTLGALGAVIGLYAGASTAAAPPPSARLSVAPATAAAHPVVLALRLTYGMTCGYPGPGPIVVTLPAPMQLPSTIKRTAVLVDHKPAYSVGLSGRAVSVGFPPPPKVLCQTYTFGTLTLTFSAAAGLGNPARAGNYPVLVRRQRDRFRVDLVVVPG